MHLLYIITSTCSLNDTRDHNASANKSRKHYSLTDLTMYQPQEYAHTWDEVLALHELVCMIYSHIHDQLTHKGNIVQLYLYDRAQVDCL